MRFAIDDDSWCRSGMEQRVLILGATSAIASEVARLYAARGARLHLVGRNDEKLARLVGLLPADQVTSRRADFADLDAAEDVIAEAFVALGGHIDVALVAHGDLGDQRESERSFAAAQATIVANFTSVVALLIPLANHLEAARGGTLGVITSVAGDRGRPRNYTYGAAKGALNVFLQGLRSRLVSARVKVTTLKLGPVDTPMTREHPKTALFGKPPAVARAIVAALDAGAAEAYVPAFWGAIMPVVKNTPERLFQALPFLSGR
jgi:decaprenylphospho-beta-D-erythro-pentofuranosid-2-ulose 2-reductase